MRRRTIAQLILLAAGVLVLATISIASVLLVNRARDDSAWVLHTVEVQAQISSVLLELRRAESSARAYVLTRQDRFRHEHDTAAAQLLPALERLQGLISDSPVELGWMAPLREAVKVRAEQFLQAIERAEANDIQGATELLHIPTGTGSVGSVRRLADEMTREEQRLLNERIASADRSQALAQIVTVTGSAVVLLFAAIAVVLIRRSMRARYEAEAKLRESNLNLESTVQERTADLREANEEIQRFAYIVSHDLRSPLVNIMGFTSELEELRHSIFRRIASLSRPADAIPEPASAAVEPALDDADRALAEEFSEALSFIKSSIGKMDRLISAILNLTREGRREFKPEQIDTKSLIDNIAKTVAHQAIEAQATITVEPLPGIVSDRLALEQIFSNLIDNALKYLRKDVPGVINVSGRLKLGFAVFEVKDNGRGVDPKDHQRIFELFRRAGVQDRPGQGIGLAHVRALVRRLGGTMSVQSELGAGSTFVVTLPAKWAGASRNSST
jgi:signal transduction histidine kinase